MFSVALVGPDGAGKTTVARRLAGELDVPVAYLYMGVSAESSNRLLPTTRLAHALKRLNGAPPDRSGPRAPLAADVPRHGARRGRAAARAWLRLANQLAEEWHRQLLAWRLVRRGKLVVFDRHFFADYHAYDVAGGDARPWTRRVHGFLLRRAYPKPALVIYLDAPGEVLWARKGEGTIEALERRRADYLRLADHLPAFSVVDAGADLDDVVAAVAARIREFARTRKQAS